MKKIPHKYKPLALALSIVVGVLAVKAFYEKFIEDRIERSWAGEKHGFTASNLEKAESDLLILEFDLLNYIDECQRFPLNPENVYKPVENDPRKCSHKTPTDRGIVTSWIDPWGRPYQIRYHKERSKLQVRSQGRNLDDPRDDIVRETNLTIHRDIYNAELEECKKLSSDDKNCVFNRGWH